jgi:hypothetical protein
VRHPERDVEQGVVALAGRDLVARVELPDGRLAHLAALGDDVLVQLGRDGGDHHVGQLISYTQPVGYSAGAVTT